MGMLTLARSPWDATLRLQDQRRTWCAKTGARFILEALKTAKCQPSEMIYVGDDPALDVEAARSLGIFTVWFQSPDAKKPEVEPNYHATIHELDELPTAIERIEQY